MFTSAYRAHKMLATHVSDALARAVNNTAVGPVTGELLTFTVCTGDNVDNTQFNELRWFIDLLDGERVRPDSGDLSRWEGVADGNPLYYDRHYWHPDGTPALALTGDDRYRQVFGFPTTRWIS